MNKNCTTKYRVNIKRKVGMVNNETTFHIFFCYLITKHVLKTQCEDVNNTYHAHVHVTGSCLRLNTQVPQVGQLEE